MATISHPAGWHVDISDEQASIGFDAARRADATHYRIWRSLVDAGVPVRDEGGRTLASLAATAINEQVLQERGF